MKILFVHQNFPGQFPHLAPALKARGHDVVALTCESNTRTTPVRTVRYRAPAKVETSARLARLYCESTERGAKAALGARQMREQHGYVPDLVVGHSGWGETLFLKEVWPEAKLVVYAELMYRAEGLDVGFDPEFRRDPLGARVSAVARSAHLALSMLRADAGLSPTRFQAGTFPPELRAKIEVIFDGVDTARLAPDPAARLALPGGRVLAPGEEVLTFVNRSLEPYRGYHSFMRALPEVMAARPEAQVVIVGEEGQSYGPAPQSGSWKARFLDEVRDRIDLARVHFLGRVPYPVYVNLLQVSRVHCYLTYPFVLSWSLMESMGAGCAIIASDTAPVREMITDGVEGRLVGFFDIRGLARALIGALESPEDMAPMRAAARAKILRDYDLAAVCLPRQIEFLERIGGAARP